MIALAIICMLLTAASPYSTDFEVTDWTNDTTTDQAVLVGNTTTTASNTTVNSNSTSFLNTTVSTNGGGIQQQLIDIQFLTIGLFFLAIKTY